MQTIAIINYNMGNLYSVGRAISHVAPDHQVLITADPERIRQADRIVFPGQGAARDCMKELTKHELVEVIHEVAQNKPFLGICMGMQVLMTHSEENQGVDCLGIFAGQVRSFASAHTQQTSATTLKIPQMGWNQIWQTQAHPLWQGIKEGARFYFVHSYYLDLADQTLSAGETDYGIRYPSAIAHDNIFAMQCHPEKSATDGLRLLQNFIDWQP